MPMKYSIVILNWNRCADTLECLASIQRLHIPCSTIVVDNGSTDGSLEAIRAAFPTIQIIEMGSNLGYAAGNNRGIKAALDQGADWIVLLNNDTVIAPQFLDALQEASLAHPRAGAFGAKIYYYDEPATLWYAGGEVDRRTLRCYHVGCGEADLDKRHEEIRQTGYACGCAIALKTQALREIGLLDPCYFLLWEEIDWCWRLRKAGWECLFLPKAKVWHKVSASFPEGHRGPLWQYHYYRSRRLFIRSHCSRREKLFFHLLRRPSELFSLALYCLLPTETPSLRRRYFAALRGSIDLLHY